jgi:hypothetical protein
MKKFIICLLLSSSVVALSGCGGGSGGSSATGTATTDVSKGPITGFGSVFVNGTRFNTDNALISRDGQSLDDVTDLNIGMIVTVSSNSNSTTANSVSFDEDVKGPLDNDLASFDNSFSVMGQTIVVDGNTIIDNSLMLPLSAGQILEISGTRQMGDSLLATFIEIKNFGNLNQFKVIGNARALDPDAKSFKIGGLTVDYNSAILDDFDGGNPVEGQLLEVKDSNLTYVAGSGMLTATKIEPVNPFGDTSNSQLNQVEIETVVTEIVSAGTQFKTPNFTVNILPNTSFKFGILSDLGVGSVIEIKASIAENGELNATRIKFKKNSSRIEGSVDTAGVDTANNTVKVLGVTVLINSSTEMWDKRDDVTPFSINDISPNDYLSIRGFTGTSASQLIATRLERDDSDNKAEIRGLATEIDAEARTLKILGITVMPGSGTQFEDSNDNVVSSAQFFAAITPGLSIVKAKWDPFTDVSLAPKELELEDEFSNNSLSL